MVDNYLKSDSDPLKNSVLRYNGFWNDLGEACKNFLPKSVYISTYVATGTYAALSVYYTNKRLKENNDSQRIKKTIDCSIWHFFATVSITPLVISKLKKSIKTNNKWIPSVVGIGSIPILVPPVDNLTTFVMNQFRKEKENYHWSGIYSNFNKK